MIRTYISEILEKPLWLLFLYSWLFYLAGLILFSQFVWDSSLYGYNFKGADFEQYLNGIRRVDLIRYFLSPLWILLASSLIWLLIRVGILIGNIEFNGKLLFKIILLSLFFISLPFWIKSIWFVLIKGSYTPDDVKYFFPGSLIPFIKHTGMSLTEIKAISRFNVFHLAFIVTASWMISINSRFNFLKSTLLVFLTYGLGMILIQLLIVVIVM